MKKTMVEYISVLSENKMDLLEEIINHKYKKFTELYWMLKEYSNYISSLKYKSTKKEILKIEVKFSGIDVEKILTDLNNSIPEGSSALIWNKGKTIFMEKSCIVSRYTMPKSTYERVGYCIMS